MEPVQPFRLLKKCANADQHVKLLIKGAGNLKIETDSYFLELIFSKLIQNSIQYSSTDEVAVTVTCKRMAQFHRFNIVDNADGMTTEIREHIFEMLFKGNPKSIGSGLGLYIVRKAIEKLRGEIEVADAYHTESVFTLLLPLNLKPV